MKTKLVLGILLAILLLVAFLPSLLNTAWGQRWLIALASSRIPGKIAAKSIQLSWFSGQNIEGLTLFDPEDQWIATIDQIKLDSTLIHLALSGPARLKVALNGLNASLHQDESGKTNWERALGLPSSNRPLPPFTIELKEGNGELHITSLHAPIHLHLSGKTLQNKLEGSFHIEAHLAGFQPDQIHSLKGEVVRFPIALVDQLVAIRHPEMTGVLCAAIGDTLDARFDHSQNSFTASLHSPTFHAELQGAIVDDTFSLIRPATIRFEISQELAARFPQFQDLQGINLAIESLITPLSPTSTSQLAATIQCNYQKQPLVVAIKAAYEPSSQKLDAAVSSQVLPFGFNDFRATLKGKIGATGKLEVTTQVKHKILTTPLLLNLVGHLPLNLKAETGDFECIAENQQCKMRLTANVRNFLSLADLHLKGQVAFEQLALDAYGLLRDVTIPLEIDAKENRISALLAGSTGPTKLLGNITILNWIKEGQIAADQAHIIADVSLPNLPSLLAEKWLKKPMLSKLLGPSLTLSAKANWNGLNPSNGFLDILLDGDQLEAKASLLIDKQVTLRPGAPRPSLAIKLTPERFQGLRELVGQPKNGVILNNHALLTVSVSSLTAPLGSIDKAAFALDITLDKMRFSDKDSSDRFELSGIKGQISDNAISLHALDGSWSLNGTKESLTSNFQRFPLSLAVKAIGLERNSRLKLEALLGSSISGEFAAKFEGPVHVAVEGQNGRLQLDGNIFNKTLQLNKPFQLEVSATPEFGRDLMKEAVPLFSGILSADERIKVLIDPSGFSLPISFTGLSSLQIGQMQVHLGKMQFNNEGQLGKLMRSLKVPDGENISVWFTPIYLNITGGIINVQRFDMLVMNAYPLATWGTIDLNQEWVEMVVGLKGRTLKRTTGIAFVDSNAMVQIPLRGKLGAASIDKGKLAGSIAKLAAEMDGTPQGLVLGTVISLATGGGGLLDEKAPEPTTNPLPWESAAGEEEEEENERRQDNPVKMLQKGAGSLLRNLIR